MTTRPLLFAFLAAVLLSSGCARTPTTATSAPEPASPPPSSSPTAQAATVLPHPVLSTLDAEGRNGVADVAERVTPSVVSVYSTKVTSPADSPHPFGWFFGPPAEQRQQGLGSGVVVANGVVVTNNHVVEGADEIKIVSRDDHEYDVEVVGTDPKSDLAVLRIQGDSTGLVPLPMGDSSKLRLGDVVLAIGNPFGIGQTVTMGIVSAKGRSDLGIVHYEDFIQTDAAINPGNSGGALVSMAGELVGINTAIVSRSGGYQAIGFAIPTNMARPIVESLLTSGHVSRGWLGVHIQDIDTDLAEALGLKDTAGVLVADVGQDTPAARAGLKRGDVILEVGGKTADTTGRLRNLVAAAGAEARVELLVLRDGKKRKVSVLLGAIPDEPEGVGPTRSSQPKAAPLDGLTLQDLTPDLRERLGVAKDVKSGVVVARVQPSSEAARAGLRPGDVIVELNRQPTSTIERFAQLWKKAKGKCLLLVHRRGVSQYVVVAK